MSWEIYKRRRVSLRKYFTKCFIFFHDWEYTDAQDCKPQQILVLGVRVCQRCGLEEWL